MTFLKQYIKNQNLIKHSLAVEISMSNLADYFSRQADSAFKENKEKWGLAGLLHDIDYEITQYDPQSHGLKARELLKDFHLDEDIFNAIEAHNVSLQIMPKTLMAKSLICVDPLTGLIVASVLVLPSKQLKLLGSASVLKHFKEKSFARNISREQISLCETYLGISLDHFVAIVLEAMKTISDDLGL